MAVFTEPPADGREHITVCSVRLLSFGIVHFYSILMNPTTLAGVDSIGAPGIAPINILHLLQEALFSHPGERHKFSCTDTSRR